MKGPMIVKLGGSVITDKRRNKPIARMRDIKRLAREIAKARRSRPLILLYGGGSFGHPLARQYRLSGRALSRGAFFGLGKTSAAMRVLGGVLAGALMDEGIPIVPLQTSAFVKEEKGRLISTNLPLLKTILAKGGVPLLGGDGVIADGRRIEIASADRLAVTLARHFHSHKVFFATDVDGVYKTFPPKKEERPLRTITRKSLGAFSQTSAKGNARDVTGAMGGKLRALFALRACTVTIFNGLTPGALGEVLRDKQHGTRIEL